MYWLIYTFLVLQAWVFQKDPSSFQDIYEEADVDEWIASRAQSFGWNAQLDWPSNKPIFQVC